MKKSNFIFCFIVSIFSANGYSSVIRDYYEEPGINPFKGAGTQEFMETIDTFSGMLQVGVTSIQIPGNGGFDIKIRQNYATPFVTSDERTPYGYGWNMHFGRIIVAADNADKICSQSNWASSVTDNPSIEMPNGSRQLLVLANYHSPMLITKTWWSAECDGGDVIVKSPDGMTYHMTYTTSTGDTHSIYATLIEDRNGNSMTVNYQTNPAGFTYIESLTASDGREVEFNYDDISTGDIRLAEIKANDQSWVYEYTFPAGVLQSTPQLSRIIRPDNQDWIFKYNPIENFDGAGSLALRELTTPSGGVTSYGYGYAYFDSVTPAMATTVVTSKSVDGTSISEGEWSYQYTPGFSSGSGYDETVVTQPDGSSRKDYHLGYTSVGSGQVWKTGLKEYEELYDSGGNLIEQISYIYTPMVISDENFWHGRSTLKVDSQTYVPVLQESYHYRESYGVSTYYTDYSSYGQAQKITETSAFSDYSDKVTSYTYSNNDSSWLLGLVTQESINHSTDSPVSNWVIDRTFDDAGNILSEDRFGVKTLYSYTDEGDISSINDANGNITKFSDYYRGIARIENQPGAVTVTRTVNNTGTLASTTDGNGNSTSYIWDDINRLTGINYPVNADVAIGYTKNQRTLIRDNYTEVTTWDGFDQDLDVIRTDNSNQLSIEITRTRDSVGRITFESYPNSNEGIASQYDAYGRIISKQYSSGEQITYEYPSATKTLLTDENGHATEYRYFYYGSLYESVAKLAEISSPESMVTLLKHDGLGELYGVYQGEDMGDGSILAYGREYIRDSRGFLVSEVYPETGTTTYTHDAVGNILTREVLNHGVTEAFTYDARNRVISKMYSDTTPAVTYSYDNTDKVLGISSSVASRNYSYDANGNLQTESLSVGTVLYEAAYGINSLDFVDSLTYPSGRTVNLTPDALGRQTTAGPYVTQVDYHPNGAPASITLGNGATTTQMLDQRYRLASIVTTVGGAPVVDLGYTYDNSRNVTAITDGTGDRHNRTMVYDGLDRLITATGTWGTDTITYNAYNNITGKSRNGVTQSFYYSGMKPYLRVLPNKSLPISHDLRGNVTNDSVNTYVYNSDDKLITATAQGRTIKYGYDGEGGRVSRSDDNKTTHYFYSNEGLLLGEYNPAGGFDEYIYLNGKVTARIRDTSALVGPQ